MQTDAPSIFSFPPFIQRMLIARLSGRDRVRTVQGLKIGADGGLRSFKKRPRPQRR